MNNLYSWRSKLAIALATAACGTAAFAQTPQDSLQVVAGGALVSQPEYPGASKEKTRLLPVLQATYGRYFFGGLPGGTGAGLGLALYRDDNLLAGVGLSADVNRPRKESDDARLHGLGDVTATTMATGFLIYSRDWMALKSSFSKDAGGKHRGELATLDLEIKYSPVDALVFSAGPGVTWADSKYNQAYFGIDATQSANSGRPMFHPQRGVNQVRMTIGANYRLTPQWSLLAKVSLAKLQGDAALSPIVEKRTQNSAGISAAYRF
jgi:outer membrane protein